MDHKDRTVENAYTQVAGSVSFRDYFEKYMSADQQKQWLGPERYKIWQRGNLTLDKFIAPYPDKRLTVDALKDLDKNRFKVCNDKKILYWKTFTEINVSIFRVLFEYI